MASRSKTYLAQTRPTIYNAIIVDETIKVKTLEGVRSALKGDYLLTGHSGEQWAVPHDRFMQLYEIVEKLSGNRLRVQKKIQQRLFYQTYVPVVFLNRGEKFFARTGDFLVKYADGDVAPVKPPQFFGAYHIVGQAKPDESFDVTALLATV